MADSTWPSGSSPLCVPTQAPDRRRFAAVIGVLGQFELRVGAAAHSDRGETDPIWLGANPNPGHDLQRRQVENGDIIAVYVGDVGVPAGWIDDDAVRSFAR